MPNDIPYDKRVLICEENPEELMRLFGALSEDGFQPTVTSELHLLGLVRRLRPAVLVLGCSGGPASLGLIEILRGDPACRRTGVLVLTSSALSVSEILGRGANAVMPCPFETAALLDEVRRLSVVAERIPLSLPLFVRRGSTRAGDVRGTTLDLSETGMLLRCDEALFTGENCLIRGSLPQGDFVLTAEVVRHAAERGPGHYGLRFRHEPAHVRAAIGFFHLTPAAA